MDVTDVDIESKWMELYESTVNVSGKTISALLYDVALLRVHFNATNVFVYMRDIKSARHHIAHLLSAAMCMNCKE